MRSGARTDATGLDFTIYPQLVVPLETVKANFAAYGLLDEQVRFLAGWFRDTLPAAPVKALAVLRFEPQEQGRHRLGVSRWSEAWRPGHAGLRSDGTGCS